MAAAAAMMSIKNSVEHDHPSHACFFRYGKRHCQYTSDPNIIALFKAAGGV
jgi:hypothetical protein